MVSGFYWIHLKKVNLLALFKNIKIENDFFWQLLKHKDKNFLDANLKCTQRYTVLQFFQGECEKKVKDFFLSHFLQYWSLNSGLHSC
jgi:hypothetical protein